MNNYLKIPFWTYVSGSYFGEIEIFEKCPRMFSLKAGIT